MRLPHVLITSLSIIFCITYDWMHLRGSGDEFLSEYAKKGGRGVIQKSKYTLEIRIEDPQQEQKHNFPLHSLPRGSE